MPLLDLLYTLVTILWYVVLFGWREVTTLGGMLFLLALWLSARRAKLVSAAIAGCMFVLHSFVGAAIAWLPESSVDALLPRTYLTLLDLLVVPLTLVAVMAGALICASLIASPMQSGPGASVEPTSSGKLRLPAAAAHVER